MCKFKYLTVITIGLFLGASEELRFKGKKKTDNRKIKKLRDCDEPSCFLTYFHDHESRVSIGVKK